MRRAERLFRLVNELRSRGVSRAEDLAAYFEISARTVYLDIAHLQASGLPIEGEAGVGYILRPGFDLPAMTFTFEQIDALAMGLSFVEVAGDTSLSEAAREVRLAGVRSSRGGGRVDQSRNQHPGSYPTSAGRVGRSRSGKRCRSDSRSRA